MELKRKVRFTITGCVFGCVLVLSASLVNAEELGPYIGFYNGKGESAKYTIMCSFGVEQWEDNKQSTFRYQQWHFTVSYPDVVTKQRSTSCVLERTVFDGLDRNTALGAIVASRMHSQTDGTLKLHRVDWKKGILDFTIVFDDMSTAEIMLRMKYKDGAIYLESFKAAGIARGILSDTIRPIEYRIPKYTYTLNVPIKMQGLHSEEDKKRDDMLSTMSKEDQIAWEKFEAEMPMKCKSLDKTLTDEETLKRIMPDYERRKPELDKGGPFTPEERAKLEAIFHEEWTKCISKSSLSVDGRSKISNEMERSFREAFSK
jgi:hypothetical protein